jgi:hypothetical protein
MAPMQSYKLWTHDTIGQITSCQDLECQDDLVALTTAQHRSGSKATQMWQGSGLVAPAMGSWIGSTIEVLHVEKRRIETGWGPKPLLRFAAGNNRG